MSEQPIALQHAIEQFLYREARLMDGNDYDSWLALWSEECEYWVPSNDAGHDPSEKVSLIYAGLQQLTDRVWRLKGLHAHTQRPQSRLTRVIGNVEIESLAGDDITVHATFILSEVRKDVLTLWSGRTTHVLQLAGDDVRIKRKKVVLVNNDVAVPNLTFII